MADKNTPDIPLTDKQNIPIQDGQIPQDSNAVGQGEAYDAIGLQNIDIKFNSGNFNQLEALPGMVSQKSQALSKTLVPLIECALIELSGSSQMYKRQSFQFTPSFDTDGKFLVDFTIVYQMTAYIGTDFDLKDLQDDSTYIYNRIAPSKIKITKCEINTSDGSITIMGEI